MAKNFRHAGDRFDVQAAGARTSGVPAIDAGLAGIPVTSAVQGAWYSLDVKQDCIELALLASSAKGDVVHINSSTGALTRTNRTTAGGAGTWPFAIVVALPGDQQGPPTGRMWVKRLPPFVLDPS